MSWRERGLYLGMTWWRLLLYFLAVFLTTAALTAAGVWNPDSLRMQVFTGPADLRGTSEYSPVELLQLGILMVSGLLMAGLARDHRGFRPLAIAIGGMAFVMLVRELDYFFDRYLVDNLWQAVTAIAGAALVAYLYRHRRRFGLNLARGWPSPALTLRFAGVGIMVPFSLLVGHEPLWLSVLGDDFQRIFMLAVDEFIVLSGYLLLMLGIVEIVFEFRLLDARREPG